MIKEAIAHVIEHPKTSIAGIILGPTAFSFTQFGCGATSWKDWALKMIVGGATLVLGLAANDPKKGS